MFEYLKQELQIITCLNRNLIKTKFKMAKWHERADKADKNPVLVPPQARSFPSQDTLHTTMFAFTIICQWMGCLGDSEHLSRVIW